MKKAAWMTMIFSGFVCLFTLISCGGSDSGGGDGDTAFVKYKVELSNAEFGCQMRVKYLDLNGNTTIKYVDAPGPWNYSFNAQSNTELYIEAKSNDCDSQVTAQLYVSSERVKRITRFTATIDGILREDDQGNFSFEDLSDE